MRKPVYTLTVVLAVALVASLFIACGGGGGNSNITIGTIDAGATLTVNGTAAVEGQGFNFAEGATVTFVTSFGGSDYEDVIEYSYDIEVSVHAVDYPTHPGGNVTLDNDLGYTPYDIYVVTSADGTPFIFSMSSPPADGVVRILGFHAMVPDATIYPMGDASIASSNGGNLADIFYGTVENANTLYIETTCDSDAGSSFNLIDGEDVYFYTSCSDAQDVMIQELYATYAETYDTEISWWHMELTDQFYGDDYDGYSLNDELPEKADMDADGMLWFKARNPAKWALAPLIKIDGTETSWYFDNYDYEDYNFMEVHLAGDFYWYNDDDYNEYAHFMGPVMEMEYFEWYYYNDYLYLNFFGDNSSSYYDTDRFNGDYGSAGTDFWTPLLVNSYGYTEDSERNIVSPIFVLKLRTGDLYTEEYYDSYETEVAIADNQDLLILSDSSYLDFYFYTGVSFYEGTNSHWVVEDGLTYNNDTPTDDAFDITLVTLAQVGGSISVEASNDYDGGGVGGGVGDDTDSTMYVAYRLPDAYGQQFTKVPMTYSAGTNEWSATVTPAASGTYDFYVVATENDDIYGKVVEQQVVFTEGGTPP